MTHERTYLDQEIARLMARFRPWGTVDCLRDVITAVGWDVVTIGEYWDYRLCFVIRDARGIYTLDEVRDAVEEWRPVGVRVTVDAC